MNSTMKTVCLLYSSISLSKATQLIEEMPIGGTFEQDSYRCDPAHQTLMNILNSKPDLSHIVPISELFDRANCNWALPHDTNPCEWNFGVVRNYGNTYSNEDDPISIMVDYKLETYDYEMYGPWDTMTFGHPRYWFGLAGSTTEEFFKEAHGLDPSLGPQ